MLHYQPKINVEADTIVGAEALVRWQHPARGLICPDGFLPLVEQSGLMGTVTELVLEAAVAQSQWNADEGATRYTMDPDIARALREIMPPS